MMRAPLWTQLLLTALVCAAIPSLGTGVLAAQERQRTPSTPPPAVAVPRSSIPPATRDIRVAYERGYREGVERGERDGRDQRAFDYARHDWYRSGDRGFNARYGTRAEYRAEYRRGFEAGYRTGYDRYRASIRPGDRRDPRYDRRVPRGYHEPAAARGYSDGFEKGLDDARDRDRYDPVRHNAYKKGDQGYFKEYGSKDAYRNNYRAGFRQGYEDGYRSAGWR
jgi:hypothetical protein